MDDAQPQPRDRAGGLSQVVHEQATAGGAGYQPQDADGREDETVAGGAQQGQQNAAVGSSIMVIPQQALTSGIGIVPASVGGAHVAQGVVVGSLPSSISSSDHNQVTGLYTTAAGISAEYVIPGTGMISSGAGGFVHVPVMPQSEIHSDDGVSLHETDEDSRNEKDELREQDRFLPIANVARIMKRAIPGSGKIAKDAKECVQECVSEFVSFITSEASERCQQEKRKTINGEDILFAMSSLGFDNYVDPLKVYLSKYRESVKGEKGSLNASSERGEGELEDGEQGAIQYQVSATLHPTMVATDAATSTIYTYAATLHQQTIHFQ